jgi:peptidyl-prolyl cis-trans isomerase B (cyclophilin B)
MLAVTLSPGAAAPTARADPGAEVANWVNATVTIDTNFGVIVGMLYEQGAPITTSNFINLSTSSFYDGIKFHRIVDNFVIQTGDPNTKDNNPYNDGMGGSGHTIPLEINANLTHEDGAFGMARSSSPDSASSQFYICDGPQHQLDGNYSVFGIVVAGIEVVRTIAAQPVWGYKRPLLQQHPVHDIVMNTVVISLGYWNNTTAPAGAVGGGLLGLGAAGSAALVLVLLVAAVGMGTVVSPPFRARVRPILTKLPKPAALGERLKRLVPRRAPRG